MKTMNPFKIKQLGEFTIEDCELYINNYPCGDYLVDVKNRLRCLRRQPQLRSEMHIESYSDSQERNQVISIEDAKRNKKFAKSRSSPVGAQQEMSGGDTIKDIFAGIGGIVVVLVVVTIIIVLVSAVWQSDWWHKHRYWLYPIVYFITKARKDSY